VLPVSATQILTSTDTVTGLLAQRTGEPITTERVRHARALAGGRASALHLALGAPVIERRALLRGTRTGIRYVCADSLLAIERLPATLLTELAQPGGSIGELLGAHAIASRREVLGVTHTRDAESAELLGVDPGAVIWHRTYRIWIGGQPSILISEAVAPRRVPLVNADTY
jgi:chorismate--pyruvate lyase